MPSLMSDNISVKEDFQTLAQNLEPLFKALGPWLVTRRWSGLRGMRIRHIDLLEQMNILESRDSAISAALIRITPYGGVARKSRIFYIPLHLKLQEAKDGWVPVRCADGVLQIREAEYSREYNNFLLNGIANSLTIEGQNGVLAFRSLQQVSGNLKAMTVTTLGRGDTTNIIVKVKTRRNPALVVKTYKNVTENNPEPEMLAALAEAEFNNAPKLVGQMAYSGLKKPRVLAILQGFEESEGDGRQPFAESLRDELRRTSSESSSLMLARKLGEIIASMHHALRRSDAEGFKASLVTENDIEAWQTRTRESLTDFLKEASSKGRGHDPFISNLVTVTSSTAEKILTRLSGMQIMLGMMKIRTHQDLHLAQLLLKQNGEIDFLIIDFEGDPQRTEEVRRAKESPLRDLGTMSRSFSYLRYYVLSELLEEAGIRKSFEAIASHDLASHIKLSATTSRVSYLENWFSTSMEWETKVRKTMIQAYLTKADSLGDKLLSTKVGYDEVDSMIRLWEIERVILEANYELHHRPQHLIIPLAGLLTLCL
ncbi:hypothetical protein MUP77_23175 [Candidatus Bathyarchaeota archaeon]|nr:hypothetical protein [Candidatus Bathyarchaeota archaeon]